MHGWISGGTLGTIIATLEEVPREKLDASSDDFALSPGRFSMHLLIFYFCT
jgi:hypothetical protein